MDVPDSLATRLELFRSSGRFFKRHAQELFAEESWVQVLIGQGFDMRADPVTQFVPLEQIADFLSDISEVIEDVADRMPDHGEFVRNLPPSTPPAQASAAPANVSFTLRYERGEGGVGRGFVAGMPQRE